MACLGLGPSKVWGLLKCRACLDVGYVQVWGMFRCWACIGMEPAWLCTACLGVGPHRCVRPAYVRGLHMNCVYGLFRCGAC